VFAPAFVPTAPGLAGGAVNFQASHTSGNTPSDASASASYANLPLYFESNFGQTDSRVGFIGRASNYTLYLEPTAVVFNLPPSEGSLAGSVLRMSIEGGNANARPVEGTQLEGKVNYFIGNDPTQWFTCIPMMSQVKYTDVYAGIDAVYYANGPQLEYDFVVNSGANPDAISLKFEGAQGLELEADGDLLIHTGDGSVVQKAPLTYQETANGRETVASKYVISGDRVGFDVGNYDATRPLVIDPVVIGYSSFFGGAASDQAFGVAVAHNGSAFITGRTGSNNLPTTTGVVQPGYGGAADGYVAKVSPNGNSLEYVTYLGGSNDDYGQSIAIDRQGNAYVVGASASTNFPITAGAYQTANAGTTDAIVVKLNPTGTSLLFSTYLGGSGVDQGNGIDVHRPTQTVYVTGGTVSPNFPVSGNAYQGTHGGGADAFVTAINPAGSALVYSTYLGGAEEDRGSDLAVDGLKRVAVVGQTRSVNFPLTAGAPQGTFGGGNFDAFATRLTPNGNQLIMSTYLGGAGDDRGTGVAITGSGQTYVTGWTASAEFPVTAGAYQTAFGGVNDAFVSSIVPAGNALTYSTFIGGPGMDRGNGVVIDGQGRAYIGVHAAANYPITAGAIQTTFGGGTSDAALSQLSADGSTLLYSTFHGGDKVDVGNSIAIDRLGHLYIVGNTLSTNLPTTESSFQPANAGSDDAFIVKYIVTAGERATPRGSVIARARQAGG
jgi:hypothetical protein